MAIILTHIEKRSEKTASINKIASVNAIKVSTFYIRIFHTNVLSAAFSSYILALLKNLYKKCARLTLMKFTTGVNFTESTATGSIAK